MALCKWTKYCTQCGEEMSKYDLSNKCIPICFNCEMDIKDEEENELEND